MNKIVGFCISRVEFDIDHDPLSSGLELVTLTHLGFCIRLWGIGNLNDCIESGCYSLSFPLTDSLLDRNVTISLNQDEIVVRNDWLGSIPIFYNMKSQVISTLSSVCIDEFKINEEGFYNYARFGYSVFGLSPIVNVEQLRFYSQVTCTLEGMKIVHHQDPMLEFFSSRKQTSRPEESLSAIRNYIQNVEDSIVGDIFIPTSGGYDSRILNQFIVDKSRVKSATYGISSKQSHSYESVYANKLSDILSTDWKFVELNEFFDERYLKDWYSVFGISTHLHGMYHLEFYQKALLKFNGTPKSLLSGIVGDLWAGSVDKIEVNSAEELYKLGYTHGLSIPSELLGKKPVGKSELDYYNDNKSIINSEYNIVSLVRMKITLLSYLMQLPEYLGLVSWTPFLNFDVVTSILTLPKEERNGRKWQSDFFAEQGINLESMNLKSNKSNSLDFDVAIKSSMEQVDSGLFSDVVDDELIEKINGALSGPSFKDVIIYRLLMTPKVSRLMRMAGARSTYLEFINYSLVLKSVQMGLNDVS